MLTTKKQLEYQSPLVDILEINSTAILCSSITDSESDTEGFVIDDLYCW